MAVKWLDDPEDHDYDAAADYLSLIAEADAVAATVEALKSATDVPQGEGHPAGGPPRAPARRQRPRQGRPREDRAGKKLSPILLVRGHLLDGVALQIADGYHRVCASYLTDENTPIPCRLVSWQPPTPEMTGFGFGTLALLVVIGMVGPLLAAVPRLRVPVGRR